MLKGIYFGIAVFVLALPVENFAQTCPPADTVSVNPPQNSWNIPLQNQWDEFEVMTWNVKEFPLSSNTVNYVNEIITDLLPDVIAFQEINDVSAFSTLVAAIPAYEFINSGTGLAFATRKDVVEIVSNSTLFPNAGYNFAWRYPLKIEINWVCGLGSASFEIINVHLKSGQSSSDFDRRFASCEILSEYVNENPNSNIIIAGDYNDEITNPQSSNSLWPLVSNTDVEFATTPIADNDYYASYPSWPSFLDHISVSQPLFDELVWGDITTIRVDDYTGWNLFYNYISDHRPVIWSFPVEEIEVPGGLVINEIMQNPAVVADAAGEWIEITNTSTENVSLNGLTLRDDGDEAHVISDNTLIVPPDGFVVLGANADLALNGGTPVDYEYSSFTLSNLWDEVILEHPSGIIIDEVHYDNGTTFPDESGASMMLISPGMENDLGENWISATTPFGSGDLGTPGEMNNLADCTEFPGDMNNDGAYNVLDVVILANCILANTCGEGFCTGDLNGDGSFNVLDIVMLVNCILANTCGE